MARTTGIDQTATPTSRVTRSSRKAAFDSDLNFQRDQKTDYSRWRLLDERGRQTWHYLRTDEEVKKWPQSVADKYHLGLPTVRATDAGLIPQY